MSWGLKNSKGITEMLEDDAEMLEVDKEAARTAHKEVLVDTAGAHSIAGSGPTTACALTTVMKTLFFPCQNPVCAAKKNLTQSHMFTLNHLMPTEVEGKKKDYCHLCFTHLMKTNMSKSAFKIKVAALRAAERWAVTLDDVTMVHATLDNLIFNSYKTLMKTLKDDEQEILKRIGDCAYRKMIKDCIRQNKQPDPEMDGALIASHTLHDVLSITLSARKALGKARLNSATRATEFMRVIVGSETSQIAAGGGYYCQTCWCQPKYGYFWTKANKIWKCLERLVLRCQRLSLRCQAHGRPDHFR
jgi:hypothetical protein